MGESSRPHRYAIVDAEVHDMAGQEPPQFDVWLVPAGEVAEFDWKGQHPGGALALVAKDDPPARSAWDAGGIYEDEFPFWRVPATAWTEDLYREASRRWALAVSDDPDIELWFMRGSPLDMSREEWARRAAEFFQ